MSDSIVVGLLQNTAILLSFALLYDYIWVKDKIRQTIWNKLLTGLIIGGVGILLMLTPWTLVPGIVFDTRSIILAISGLFFGPIPTIIAMLITASYRVFLGGDGMLMGLSVIAVSGSTGILWNIFRRKSRRNIRLRDLYLLGIVVHVLMLGCVALLPAKLQIKTLEYILPTVIIIYPLGTMLLGYLLVNRIQHWDTKKALKDSEERFKMLFEKAPIGYQSLDENGRFIEVNETWLNLLGYSREEVIGKWFGDFLAPQFVEPFRERFPLFKELGKIHSEFEMVKKDGSLIVSSFEGLIGYTLAHEFKQTHCVLSDITEKVKAEKALKESEEKYKLLHEHAGVGIGYYSPEGIVLSFNELAASNMSGVKGDFEGKSIYDFFPKEEADFYMNRIKLAANSNEKFKYEDMIPLPPGKLWFLSVFTRVQDFEGNVIGVQIISQDITQRKEIEIKLKHKMDELERFNEITVGRELKMVELKEEINALLKRLGENEKYKIVK
jgi:PAS domain S-box-containing protein